MKKILAILLCLILVIGLCACGGDGKKDDGGKKDITSADVDAATFEGLKFKPNKDLDINKLIEEAFNNKF